MGLILDFRLKTGLMSETKISAEIRDMIEKEFSDIVEFTRHQCGVAKGYNGGFVRLGKKYWMDYIGFAFDGRFFGVEVKDPKGKTNKERLEGQNRLRTKICRCGGYCIQTTGVEDCRKKMLLIKKMVLQNLQKVL